MFCSNIVLKVEIILYDFTIKIEPKLIKVTLNHFTMSGGYVKEKKAAQKRVLGSLLVQNLINDFSSKTI